MTPAIEFTTAGLIATGYNKMKSALVLRLFKTAFDV